MRSRIDGCGLEYRVVSTMHWWCLRWRGCLLVTGRCRDLVSRCRDPLMKRSTAFRLVGDAIL